MKSNWAHLKTHKFTENCKQKRNSINENGKQTQITLEQPNIYVSSGQNSTTSTKKIRQKVNNKFCGDKKGRHTTVNEVKGTIFKVNVPKRD